jgi:hypothetical protein
MGIKSTTRLSRTDALEMYYDLRAKLYGERQPVLTNYELENALDCMAEEWCDRNGETCFDNFRVVDDDMYSERD